MGFESLDGGNKGFGDWDKHALSSFFASCTVYLALTASMVETPPFIIIQHPALQSRPRDRRGRGRFALARVLAGVRHRGRLDIAPRRRACQVLVAFGV